MVHETTTAAAGERLYEPVGDCFGVGPAMRPFSATSTDQKLQALRNDNGEQCSAIPRIGLLWSAPRGSRALHVGLVSPCCHASDVHEVPMAQG